MKRLIATLLVTTLAASPSEAQEASAPTIALHAIQTLSGTLGEREVAREASVDEARWVAFVVASTEELAVRLILPDGRTFSADDRPERGFEWYTVLGEREAEGGLLPGVGTGHNTIIRVTRPPAGGYDLRLRRVKPTADPAPFVITVLQDSDLRMGLWLQSARVLRGVPLAVTAVLADGGQPAADAAVQARFTREIADAVEPVGECALTDDGREPDAVAGDGVYTCLFVPPAEGRYRVAVQGRGATRGGHRFERHGGLMLLASEPTVDVRVEGEQRWATDETGGAALVVPLVLEGRPGRYDVLVTLRSPDGRAVTARREVAVDSRTETAISFAGDLLKTLGADHAIESVEVTEAGEGGGTLRARRSGEGLASGRRAEQD